MVDEFPLEIMNRAGNPQHEAYPIPTFNPLCGFFSPNEMVRAFGNFKKSGAPSRFLLLSEDAWVDFALQVFEELKSGFLAGKTTLEVTVDGKAYLFDFLRLVRIDSDTGRHNSIAWIDVHGCCFFPKNAIDDTNPVLPSPFHCPPELCEESIEVSSDRWPNAKLLRDDEKFYKIVEQLFLSGIKRFIPNIVITSIHRCSYSNNVGNSWLSSFKLHKNLMMVARGNANVKYGWYGTSADSITGIMSHGFRQPNSEQLGLAAHGTGIHLSPPHSPSASALLSEADENGERHVIFCRVILGNSEKVEAGSSQNHPSNESFDSGVDDLVNPKWLVVWRSNMNIHILPEYIVSFKPSGHSPRSRKQVGVQKSSPWRNLPFFKLFAEIEKSLPSFKIQALETLYNQYKVGKINKEIFIRYIRSIAGDKLLTSTIKSLKGQLKM